MRQTFAQVSEELYSQSQVVLTRTTGKNKYSASFNGTVLFVAKTLEDVQNGYRDYLSSNQAVQTRVDQETIDREALQAETLAITPSDTSFQEITATFDNNNWSMTPEQYEALYSQHYHVSPVKASTEYYEGQEKTNAINDVFSTENIEPVESEDEDNYLRGDFDDIELDEDNYLRGDFEDERTDEPFTLEVIRKDGVIVEARYPNEDLPAFGWSTIQPHTDFDWCTFTPNHNKLDDEDLQRGVIDVWCNYDFSTDCNLPEMYKEVFLKCQLTDYRVLNAVRSVFARYPEYEVVVLDPKRDDSKDSDYLDDDYLFHADQVAVTPVGVDYWNAWTNCYQAALVKLHASKTTEVIDRLVPSTPGVTILVLLLVLIERIVTDFAPVIGYVAQKSQKPINSFADMVVVQFHSRRIVKGFCKQ